MSAFFELGFVLFCDFAGLVLLVEVASYVGFDALGEEMAVFLQLAVEFY